MPSHTQWGWLSVLLMDSFAILKLLSFIMSHVLCLLLFSLPDEINSIKCTVKEVLLLLFSCSVVSDSWQPHGLQHARLPWPSPSPGACSNSCLLSWWCHPTISSSVVSFSSHLQCFPAIVFFLMSWLFASGGQTLEFQPQHLKISFKIDWFDLAVQGTLKSLLQNHN